MDKVNEELDQSNQKLSNNQQSIYKGSKDSSDSLIYYGANNPYGCDLFTIDIIAEVILDYDAQRFSSLIKDL